MKKRATTHATNHATTLVLALGLGATTLAACHAPAPAAATNANDGATSDVAAFEAAEDELLRGLSALDRRMASRTRVTPREDDLRRIAMAAVLAEDPNLAVVDGAIDPFSFEARERGLASARKFFETTPANLPDEATGPMPMPALERELLGRILRQESERLDEERKLPRSASALLRGVVTTWTTPASADQAAERDRWLARRLGEVETSVRREGLDVVRARELDDALDALEHAMDQPGLGESIAELVELRRAIEDLHERKAPEPVDWNVVVRRLDAHLGLGRARSFEAIAGELDRTEKTLRDAARAMQTKANLADEVLEEKIPALVFDAAPCVDAVPGSRVRSMAPPPERAAICHLKHALDKADDASAMALALVAMHEHVVIAEWALDVLHGSTLEATQAKHRPMSLPTPDAGAHWERVALARPVAAIGAGLGASVLVAGDPKARAKSWVALGDVPIDLAERLLATTPASEKVARK